MQTQLIVNLFGNPPPQALAELFALIEAHHCHSLDSRITALDAVVNILIRLQGNWDRVTRLESALNDLAQRHQMALNVERNPNAPANDRHLPYIIDAIGLVSAGVTSVMAQFCRNQGIVLREMSSHVYRPAHSTEKLIQLRAWIQVPADLHLGRMKSDFFDLCDNLNLDAAIEPDRNA